MSFILRGREAHAQGRYGLVDSLWVIAGRLVKVAAALVLLCVAVSPPYLIVYFTHARWGWFLVAYGVWLTTANLLLRDRYR